MAPKGGLVKAKPIGQAYKDKSKPADVRSSNINAAKGKKFEKKWIKFNENHNDVWCLCVFYDENLVSRRLNCRIIVVFSEYAMKKTFGLLRPCFAFHWLVMGSRNIVCC